MCDIINNIGELWMFMYKGVPVDLLFLSSFWIFLFVPRSLSLQKEKTFHRPSKLEYLQYLHLQYLVLFHERSWLSQAHYNIGFQFYIPQRNGWLKFMVIELIGVLMTWGNDLYNSLI